MTIKPLADRVVIKNIELEEIITSGIILPGAAKEKPQVAEVLSVGPGGLVDGNQVDMYLKPGDKVLYSKYAGTEVKIDKEVFEDKEALTYDDFVYITYRALRSEKLIDTPKTQGSKTIKQLPHYAKITDASIYRAAYVSFLENGLFYDVNINPSNNARRVDLAIAIAAVIENND